MKWNVPIPAGISSPIVAGDNLVITAFDDAKLYTIAYRRADGKEAWRAEAPAKSIEAFHKIEGSPAASTPATDGERIVSDFGSCGLFCYDLSTSLENGVVTVLKAGSEKPVVVAQNLELGERCSANPAIADDAIYQDRHAPVRVCREEVTGTVLETARLET